MNKSRITPKYRVECRVITNKGVAYGCIIYGKTIEELQKAIEEKKKEGIVEDVRFFRFTSQGNMINGCMEQIYP